nr:hypothetical protein [uncultured Tolumonas sp.]
MGQFVDSGLLLAGDVYISDILSAGNYGPAIGPINVSECQATPPTSEEKNRISNKKFNYGQNLDSVQVPKDPAKLSITWDTATKSLLADAVAGKAVSFTAASATFTDIEVTLSEDGYTELPNQDIDTASWSVTPKAGGSALVEGTDYEVNRDMGLIKALKSSAAIAVKVTGKTKAVSGIRITGATEITKPRRVLIDGINLATNQKVRVIFHQVTFTAKGATDLMKGDFVEGQLEGTLVTPAGKDAPWEMKIMDV